MPNLETLINAYETAKSAREAIALENLFAPSTTKALRAAERAERAALAAVRAVEPCWRKFEPRGGMSSLYTGSARVGFMPRVAIAAKVSA